MNTLPEKIEPKCHVCMSELRQLVDRMGVMGYSIAHIARHIQETDPAISRDSISRHLKKHADFDQAALREILEKRAKEQGILEDKARSRIVTRDAVLEQFINQGWKRIIDPEAKVPYEVVLKAVELQEMLERQQETAVIDTVTRQLGAIIQAIREVIPTELHEPLARRAESIFDAPVLAELPPGDPRS